MFKQMSIHYPKMCIIWHRVPRRTFHFKLCLLPKIWVQQNASTTWDSKKCEWKLEQKNAYSSKSNVQLKLCITKDRNRQASPCFRPLFVTGKSVCKNVQRNGGRVCFPQKTPSSSSQTLVRRTQHCTFVWLFSASATGMKVISVCSYIFEHTIFKYSP